jgi:signal transduction histidine kinase
LEKAQTGLGSDRGVKPQPPQHSFTVTSGPLKGLSVRQLFYTLLLTLAVVVVVRAAASFGSPFWLSYLRGVIAAVMLLLAYTLAGNLRVPLVSQRTLKYLLVPIMAPMGLMLAYVLTMSPDSSCCSGTFFQNHSAIEGWAKMSAGAVLAASTMAFLAISRERDRDADDQRRKFEFEREHLERLTVAARMEAMRVRMEPHFLFNTLANIQQLVRDGSPHAADVLCSLIAYLRAAIVEDRNGMTSLAQEFDRARHYLAIMQMRLPDRLWFELVLPHELETVAFPALALLTLVENAVAHGIEPSENGGWIRVSARAAEGDVVQIDVQDTGVGLAADAGTGFGLRNLRERLAVAWADGVTLSLQNTSDGTLARISVSRTALQTHASAQPVGGSGDLR